MATDDLRNVSVHADDDRFSVDPVVLADVEISFTIGELIFLLPCQAVERLAPEPEVTLNYKGNARSTLEPDAIQALISANGTELRASINSGNSTAEATLYARVPPYFGVSQEGPQPRFYLAKDLTEQQSQRIMQEVSFCIINMHIVSRIGYEIESKKGSRQIGGTTIQDNEWTIQIRQSPHHEESTKFLRAVGGFRITHIVSMHRTDGTSFSIDEAKSKINAVRLLLSFSNGAYVGVCRVRGTDESSNTVWEEWDCLPAAWSNGIGPDSWLRKNGTRNCREGQAIRSVSPNLIDLIESEDSIRKSIERYLTANITKPYIDVISGRTMGEIAAAVLCPVPNNPWREIAATLKDAGVSLDIPTECPNLQKLYDDNPKWERKRNGDPDNEPGPWTLRKIRVHFEHPKSKIRGIDAEYAGLALYEAWHLGQWYIETVILERCGYRGERANRARGRTWEPLTQ